MLRRKAVICAIAGMALASAQPAFVAASRVEDLPLPVRGYQVYMVGELHGVGENAPFQVAYLERLAASGLRDVAIEEDAVYEAAAQAFVDGDRAEAPVELCLRLGLLREIRALNVRLAPGRRIRVHLTDVDSPAEAICEHLRMLGARLRAGGVAIPAPAELKERGAAAVARLKALAVDDADRAALRTVEYSIEAYRQGLEAGAGPSKGSPYLEAREAAVAANIADVARSRGAVLVLYGSDHVSRKTRRDGGPGRDHDFKPMALRLAEAGLRVHGVITFPLKASVRWRGRVTEMPWGPEDSRLTSGRNFLDVLGDSGTARYFFVDASVRPRLASQDISNMTVDAFVLFREGTPMENLCPGGR
ncbi:MAG: hypothetical protein JSU00_22470 [Acidobacteria bacterium]|nr:hypothetical protein [Acidobacteriota bacterium]